MASAAAAGRKRRGGRGGGPASWAAMLGACLFLSLLRVRQRQRVGVDAAECPSDAARWAWKGAWVLLPQGPARASLASLFPDRSQLVEFKRCGTGPCVGTQGPGLVLCADRIHQSWSPAQALGLVTLLILSWQQPGCRVPRNAQHFVGWESVSASCPGLCFHCEMGFLGLGQRSAMPRMGSGS